MEITENTTNPNLVYIDDIGPENDTILKNPEPVDTDTLFVSTKPEDSDACKYILDTFNMVDSDTKSRLQKMLNSLPIDEVLAFCRDLRDEIMYNVLDLSFDSACDIEETPEPIVDSESIHDLTQYDDFDEGFYDEEEQINIFRTSLASPGAEITFELTVNDLGFKHRFINKTI